MDGNALADLLGNINMDDPGQAGNVIDIVNSVVSDYEPTTPFADTINTTTTTTTTTKNPNARNKIKLYLES